MDCIAHPETVWAQRNDRLYLTIRLDDCTSPQIKIEEDSFKFSGRGGKEQKNYAIELEFYDAVDPNESKQHLTARELVFVIKKKEVGPYWPRLQKAPKRPPFLHTDFNKWRDEDDSDDEEDKGFDEANFEDMMANMGAGGNSSEKFDPGEVDDVDSDDEELPDLQE